MAGFILYFKQNLFNMIILRSIVIVLLLFNGAGALLGGWGLISDSSGKGLHLPVNYLENSLFRDYLIPGMILFIANGLFSYVVLVFTLFKWKSYSILVIAQGLLLTGWIMMMMIQFPYFLHYVFGSIGVFLIILGFLLKRQDEKKINI